MPGSTAPRGDPDRLLRLVARALPREFRERVFEPALADLRISEGSSHPRAMARVVLVAECLRIGMPQYLWTRRRPTRLGVACLAALVLLTLMMARYESAKTWREQDALRAAGR